MEETEKSIPPSKEYICDKIAYYCKKVANDALKIIRETEQDHKKPVRSYECEKCSQWHLTSIPYETWKEMKRKAVKV